MVYYVLWQGLLDDRLTFESPLVVSLHFFSKAFINPSFRSPPALLLSIKLTSLGSSAFVCFNHFGNKFATTNYRNSLKIRRMRVFYMFLLFSSNFLRLNILEMLALTGTNILLQGVLWQDRRTQLIRKYCWIRSTAKKLINSVETVVEWRRHSYV